MTSTSLQDQLDEITANTRQLVQAERLAIGERAIEELFATRIEERILPVGRGGAGVRTEGFERQNWCGRPTCCGTGPLVIKFFRGRWCPYCMTELETWRDLYGSLRERGAVMVAIGPQIERQSDFMAGQHGLPVPGAERSRATRWPSSSAWSGPCPTTSATTTARSWSTSHS